MPKDDNISDVEEQTAFRGGGGSQKSNIYFSIFKIFDRRNWAKIFYFFLPRAVLKTALGSFFI